MATLTDQEMADQEAERIEREQAARFMAQQPGLTAPSISGPQAAPPKAPVTGDREKAKEAQVGGLAGKAFTGPKKKEEGEESSSGAWTNLEDYLKSNVAATEQMKEDYTKSFEEQAAGSQEQISGLRSGFEEQLGGALEGYGLTEGEDVSSQVGGLMGDLDSRGFWGDYQGIDRGTKDQLEKWYQANYGGPMSTGALEGWEQSGKDVRGFEERLRKTETEAGRMGQLREEELAKRPSVSYGETALNQALMGREGLAGVEALRDLYGEGQLSGQRQKDFEETSALGTGAQQMLGDVQKQTKESIGSAIGDIESGSRGALTDAQKQQLARDKRLQAGFADPTQWTGQDLSDLGILGTNSSGNAVPAVLSMWGLRPEDFYQQGQQANLADVVEREDVDRYRALTDITGEGDAMFGAVDGSVGGYGVQYKGDTIVNPKFESKYGDMGRQAKYREEQIYNALANAYKQAQEAAAYMNSIKNQVKYTQKYAMGYGSDSTMKDNPYKAQAVKLANLFTARYNNMLKEANALYGQGQLSDKERYKGLSEKGYHAWGEPGNWKGMTSAQADEMARTGKVTSGYIPEKGADMGLLEMGMKGLGQMAEDAIAGEYRFNDHDYMRSTGYNKLLSMARKAERDNQFEMGQQQLASLYSGYDPNASSIQDASFW